MTRMQRHETLTLDALLADPLTQLVMRSDRQTAADVRNAFAAARIGRAAPTASQLRRLAPAGTMRDWFTQA